ncbi:hypothetical protein KY285_030352 [Solanum tuberosum]|nr:hypothetical protein KY289_030477 [Solanum tuberosum]KAH0655470.1 hypothetical protein KY285_030352 [Solanum tuberosum]
MVCAQEHMKTKNATAVVYRVAMAGSVHSIWKERNQEYFRGSLQALKMDRVATEAGACDKL